MQLEPVCLDVRMPKKVDSDVDRGETWPLLCLCTVRLFEECEAATDGLSVNLNNSSIDIGGPSTAPLNAVPLSPIRRDESLGTGKYAF